MPNFDPPYDSPIEHEFAWSLSKVLADGVVLEKQVPVNTPKANYRLDLVASIADRKIAFELDGKDIHTGANQSRDDLRDARILKSQAVDAIYRLTGKDVWYHMSECLLLLRMYEPRVISAGVDRLRAAVDARVLEQIDATDVADEFTGTIVTVFEPIRSVVEIRCRVWADRYLQSIEKHDGPSIARSFR